MTAKHLHPDDIKAAKQWWHSLPSGKKKYYKEHCKLGDEAKLTRFWLNAIAIPTPKA